MANRCYRKYARSTNEEAHFRRFISLCGLRMRCVLSEQYCEPWFGFNSLLALVKLPARGTGRKLRAFAQLSYIIRRF